jgi:hypothetical protein
VLDFFEVEVESGFLWLAHSGMVAVDCRSIPAVGIAEEEVGLRDIGGGRKV